MVRKLTWKRVIGWMTGVIIGMPVVFLIVVTLLNPTHESEEALAVSNQSEAVAAVDQVFRVLTFNLGYASLDQHQDFFFDGGDMSRAASEEQVLANMAGMETVMREADADFMFLQELDRDSTRSFRVDQYRHFQDGFMNYGTVYAPNYQALWVPVPILEPMGAVQAGMATFSKYQMNDAVRYALEGQESWPMILFELDRAMIKSVVPLDNGEELVLINIHLSAYDEGGELRAKQSAHLIREMNRYAEEGAYVVVGGDWNQLLDESLKHDPAFQDEWPDWLVEVSPALSEGGFQWGVDPTVPTVRDLNEPYQQGETFETVIDGFLVSANVDIVEVKGYDLEFAHSDHNPVEMRFRLQMDDFQADE